MKIVLLNLQIVIIIFLTITELNCDLFTNLYNSNLIKPKSDFLFTYQKRELHPNLDDRRIRMCGETFLQNLKRVCAVRGIYTPTNRFRRSILPTIQSQSLEKQLHRYKRFDDLCGLYELYEPDEVVTQCCCFGCTRKYLEQFCNPK